MTTQQHDAATQNWLSRQSPAVRAAWKKFPHNQELILDDKKLWVIGYGEVNQATTFFASTKNVAVYLILSSINPRIDYEAAVADGPHKRRINLSDLQKNRTMTTTPPLGKS